MSEIKLEVKADDLPPLGFRPPSPVPPSDEPSPYFKWNGSDLGPLEEQIENYEIYEKRTRVLFKDRSSAYANRLDDSIPLIADELKPIFGLTKIGRHRCSVGGRFALMSRIVCNDEGPLTADMVTPDLVSTLQRCYLYRWALGLTNNTDAAMWYRRYKSGVTIITSYRELKVGYDKTHSRGAQISCAAMKRWFKDWSVVDGAMKHIFGHRNCAELRFQIDAIVRRIDTRCVSWTGQILRRIQERCELIALPATPQRRGLLAYVKPNMSSAEIEERKPEEQSENKRPSVSFEVVN